MLNLGYCDKIRDDGIRQLTTADGGTPRRSLDRPGVGAGSSGRPGMAPW